MRDPVNSPVFNGDRKLTHIIHQAIDVAEQVKSETARPESQRRVWHHPQMRVTPLAWRYVNELVGEPDRAAVVAIASAAGVRRAA